MRYYKGRSQIQGVPKTFTYQFVFDNCHSSLIVMLLCLKVRFYDQLSNSDVNNRKTDAFRRS